MSTQSIPNNNKSSHYIINTTKQQRNKQHKAGWGGGPKNEQLRACMNHQTWALLTTAQVIQNEWWQLHNQKKTEKAKNDPCAASLHLNYANDECKSFQFKLVHTSSLLIHLIWAQLNNKNTRAQLWEHDRWKALCYMNKCPCMYPCTQTASHTKIREQTFWILLMKYKHHCELGIASEETKRTAYSNMQLYKARPDHRTCVADRHIAALRRCPQLPTPPTVNGDGFVALLHCQSQAGSEAGGIQRPT